jgi:hypothetical protein
MTLAYDGNRLSLLVSSIEGQGPQIWSLIGPDAISTVLGAGYISDATKRGLRVGDIVEVSAGTLNTAVYSSPSTADVGDANDFAAQPAQCRCVLASITAGAGSLQPAAKRVVTLPLQLADIATGTFKLGMPSAFMVLSALFRTAKAATTAAKAATLTVGISGTPVTGGVIALTSANQNTIGGSVAASAITALNVGAAGSTLEVAASAVTAFVEGDGYVEFTVADLGNG